MPIDIQNDTLDVALKKLKARENAFRKLEEISKLGSWEVNLTTKKSYWSDRSYEIYGYKVKEIEPSLDIFFSHILPEYIPEAQRKLQQMMQTKEVSSFVAKAKKTDGTIIDIFLSGQVIVDEKDNASKLIGITQDITEYVNLQNEASELLDIVEKSTNEIYIIDVEKFTYLYVNKGATKRLGYTKDEMLQMDIFAINPYLTFDEAVKIKNKNIHEANTLNRTIHKTKSGEEYPVQSYIQPIVYKNQKAFIIFDTDIGSMIELEQKLTYQAYHDSLTGLPNRLLFKDRLEQEALYAKRNSKQFALLFLDLDRFKYINDTFGHLIGDEVLLEVAKRLKDTVRECDTLARLGGDEFTIILKDLEHFKDAGKVGHKIIDAIQEPIVVKEHTFYISASIGVSIYPKDTTNAVDIVKYADTAMYKAKEDGRSKVRFYLADMTTKAYERIDIENRLRSAIENEEFEVYFQPQIDIQAHKITGVEALVRWITPDGIVSPALFIPIAEEVGFVTEIDRIVMKKSMKIFSQWKKQGFDIGKLSLNLAMKQLAKSDFYDFIYDNFKRFDFQSNWLEFEVTEGDVMQNPQKSIEVLHKLSTDGINISIDDFGTGYSSLAYLKKLPLNKLKIDRSFIMDIEKDQESRDIVRVIINLAINLNLDVIAEGVEEDPQREFLRDNNCKKIQGYIYSKPLPQNEFEKFIKSFT